MNRLKCTYRAVAAFLLAAALTVTCTSCSWLKEKQPDLPYGLEFGQSYEEVSEIFASHGVTLNEYDEDRLEKSKKSDQRLYLQAGASFAAGNENINKLDVEFTHASSLTNFLDGRFTFFIDVSFDEQNKLYKVGFSINLYNDDDSLFHETVLQEMMLYYSDVFRTKPVHGTTRYDSESWVWSNDLYRVEIINWSLFNNSSVSIETQP